MTTRAGTLRHRISIEQRTETQSMTAGDQSQGWVPFIRADWARITPTSGRELISAGAVQNAGTFEIEMRWRPGVTAKMRVTFKDRTGTTRHLNILSPPRDTNERGEQMIFDAVEGLTDG